MNHGARERQRACLAGAHRGSSKALFRGFFSDAHRACGEHSGGQRLAAQGPGHGALPLRCAVVLRRCLLVAALAAVVGPGCDFGQTGIAPPLDRIFLPAGVVADPDASLLYVVNSNSDLRFNAGTIAVVDLASANANPAAIAVLNRSAGSSPGQLAANPAPPCSKTRFSRTEDVPDDYCCRDLVDSNITNCIEPQFIQAAATVALGSFGGDIQLQRFARRDENDAMGPPVRRLFVAVRAEPSITFADVTVSPEGRAAIRCTGLRRGGEPQLAGAFCDDGWKIRRPGGATPGELVLPEEPHALVLDRDSTHGILYVGHLTVTANNQVEGGGVSTIDVCNPADDSSVRFAGLARTTFLPTALSQAVAGLSPGDPANSSTLIYATARYSAAISGMVLRSPTAGKCDDTVSPPPERDLTLVPAEAFYSPVFLPRGADIRSILFSPDSPDGECAKPEGGTSSSSSRCQAFVLHRNDSDTASNPAALVVLDRTRLDDGTVANTPTAILEVCSGPTAMQVHNAGRGSRIYITCYDDGQIYVVDPVTVAVTALIDVGAGPNSLVFSSVDPAWAYVANFANSHLSVIDLKPSSPTENHVVLRIGLPHGYGE
jgi:YVTN family beta-propeller protein